MENVIRKALFSQQDFIIKIKWKDSLVILQQNVLLLFYAIIYAGLNVISSHLSFKRYRLPHFIFEPISVSLTLFRLFWIFFRHNYSANFDPLSYTNQKGTQIEMNSYNIFYWTNIPKVFFCCCCVVVVNVFLYLFENYILSF